MSAHTPGPWKANLDRMTIDSSDGLVASVRYISTPHKDVSMVANACLIAAAPELYTALKAACDDLKLAALLHRSNGLIPAALELEQHVQLYQQRLAKAEGRG